jgi:hypothetical protein
MNTFLIIAGIALVALVALRVSLLVSRPKKVTSVVKRVAQAPREAPAINPFCTTSITAPDTACAAAKALAGQRFLASKNNVPQLPLADCEVASCACTYAHHEGQRKDGVERRAPSSSRTQLQADTGSVERRKNRGRRSTDWLP